MLKVGVLVSGGGTNLQAILDSVESGQLENVQIVTVVSNNKNAYALKRAENHGINGTCFSKGDFSSPLEQERAIINHLKDFKVDLVVLAGFLMILSQDFISAFEGRIINVHPSLLPAFGGKGFYGLKVHEAVLQSGVKVTGATVHYVTAETDAGPIILQKEVFVREGDTSHTLQARVMEEGEHIILPMAIKLIQEDLK